MLNDCKSVADLGCGLMQLRSYLPDGIRYVPVDIVARGDDTVLVDFNIQPIPELDVDGYALLGLLEYLFDIPALFNQLKGTVVTSYTAVDICSVEDRMMHAWVNSYDTEMMETIFTNAGWSVVRRETLDYQRVWQLVR